MSKKRLSANRIILTAVALMVDNIEMALETLNNKGFSMITEADLADDE